MVCMWFVCGNFDVSPYRRKKIGMLGRTGKFLKDSCFGLNKEKKQQQNTAICNRTVIVSSSQVPTTYTDNVINTSFEGGV